MHNTSLYSQSLKDILDSYNKARGMEKLSKIKAIKLTGTSIQLGMEAPFTSIVMRPGMFYLEVPFQENNMIQAYDGNEGWMVAPWTGSTEPLLLEGTDLKGIQMQADMDGYLYNYEAKGFKTEMTETVNLGKTKAYVIRQENGDGEVFKHYINSENFLLIKTESMLKGSLEPHISIYSDYKSVDGISIAHKIEVRIGEEPAREVIIEKVELNPGVDKKIFSRPAN